jgi:dolichyl-phosphate beta-glucosyltransferase
MDLSIVIPAYREATKIRRDVEAAGDFLERAGLRGEIIVVDDGSPDATREDALDVPVPEGVERRVIRLEPRRGKGYAVRTGMTASRGKFAMFADVGLCVPLEYALHGMEMIRRGECDIAHGSRKLPDSIIIQPQGFYRRLCSRLFRLIVRLFMGIPEEFSDTQCGFKVYRGDVARRLYGECISDGFMFDVEILLRALRHGYRVKEFPVEWRCDLDSRLRPARGAKETLAELAAIKKTLKQQ